MTGPSALVLSLATLAAFALAGGGAHLLVRRRERQRAVLMLVAAAVLLGNVLIWSWPVHSLPSP